jgi:hypothetical protein
MTNNGTLDTLDNEPVETSGSPAFQRAIK